MKYTLLTLLLIIPTLIFAAPGPSPKKAVWNANLEPDLAGYIIYYCNDALGDCPESVDVGNVTEHNLDGVTYPYIDYTAYDTSRNESNYGGAVPLDNTPPTVDSPLQIVPQ